MAPRVLGLGTPLAFPLALGEAMTAPRAPVAELADALERFVRHDPWSKYPAILTRHHVAELLGIEPDSVSEAVRRGHIPMVKRCGRYVIAQDVFRAWIDGRDA